MIWMIFGFISSIFAFYRPTPLTNRFKFYHRQHQLQWGEHPIKLKQPVEVLGLQRKGESSQLPLRLIRWTQPLPQTAITRRHGRTSTVCSRCRYRVRADVRNVVPRFAQGVRRSQFTEEVDHHSSPNAINGHIMTQRPSVTGDLRLHGGTQWLDQLRIKNACDVVSERAVSPYSDRELLAYARKWGLNSTSFRSAS